MLLLFVPFFLAPVKNDRWLVFVSTLGILIQQFREKSWLRIRACSKK